MKSVLPGLAHRIFERLLGSSEALASETLEIAAIPATPLAESKRAHFFKGLLEASGLPATLDDAGNVLCRIGDASRRAVLVSAHLDCACSEGSVRREGRHLVGPGVGDNSAGLAILLAVARAFLELARKEKVAPVIFAATVGEEGEGGLKGIKAILDSLGEGISEVISVDGELGMVVTRGLAIRRYRISVRGPGGHSWADFGRPSASEGIARIAAALSRLRPPKRPRTTFNIGVLRAGSRVNVIPTEAYLELDLRSESPLALERLERKALAATRCAPEGLSVETVLIDERPWGELPQASPLRAHAMQALLEVGIRGRDCTGSTEANVPLSRGMDAIAFGTAQMENVHTNQERVYVDSLGVGAAALFALLALRTCTNPPE